MFDYHQICSPAPDNTPGFTAKTQKSEDVSAKSQSTHSRFTRRTALGGVLLACALLQPALSTTLSEPAPSPPASAPSAPTAVSSPALLKPAPSPSPRDQQNGEEETTLFSPTLFWNNATHRLFFPVHWFAVGPQGSVLAGSFWSKTFYTYNINSGHPIGQFSLTDPLASAPIVYKNSAIMCGLTNTLISFNTEGGYEDWVRQPLRAPRRASQTNDQLPHPQISKAQMLIFKEKIVTLNADGLVLFIPNHTPLTGDFPSMIMLRSSPDEQGTFLSTPLIDRNVLYACTTRGHLHYVNLNNITEFGMVKNIPADEANTIAREVRVPPVAAAHSIILSTMDGTLHSYLPFRKMPGMKQGSAPTLQWDTELAHSHPYQCNRWGRPINTPILDTTKTVIFANSKDYVNAVEASSGQIIWKQRFPSGLNCAPMLWNDYLLVISEKSHSTPARLAALSLEDGSLQGSIDLPADPTSTPLLWNDYLLVGFRNGYVECYRLAEPDDVDTNS